jgi:tellurite resistance protein TerC
MHVSLWVWIATIGGLAAVLALDFWHGMRHPHAVRMREASFWVAGIVAVTILFGAGLWWFTGGRYGHEFFAGWLTEYSLSVDNLFVFVIILTRFKVPREYQSQVLLAGVAMALVLRGVFIGLGSAIVARFSWVFYLFGAFLIYTAVNLVKGVGEHEEFKENRVLRLARRRGLSPMLIVMVAIGTTDLLFALDSIPAIFGLTKEPYIVFTANAFALLGLRQLYFLLGGLMDRLVYLSYGLSAILAFIGVKMLFEALHGSGVEHVGPVPVPTFGIGASLAVIVGTLAVTTAASLAATRRAPEAAESEPVLTSDRG